MENAIVPVLNLVILGAFFAFGLRELSKSQPAVIKVKDQDIER
ncbi:MAG: hypothetical protein ABR578_07290 [Chromatocurvus sp.]